MRSGVERWSSKLDGVDRETAIEESPPCEVLESLPNSA
jgi:hypothetical protein